MSQGTATPGSVLHAHTSVVDVGLAIKVNCLPAVHGPIVALRVMGQAA